MHNLVHVIINEDLVVIISLNVFTYFRRIRFNDFGHATVTKITIDGMIQVLHLDTLLDVNDRMVIL